MANHPSAEKRNRQREKRTLRNRAIKAAVRTQIKTVRTAIASKDPAAAAKALTEASVAIAKAAEQGRAAQEVRLAQGLAPRARGAPDCEGLRIAKA